MSYMSYVICHKCHMSWKFLQANLSRECAMCMYLDCFVVVQFSGLKPFDVVIPACPSHPNYLEDDIIDCSLLINNDIIDD